MMLSGCDASRQDAVLPDIGPIIDIAGGTHDPSCPGRLLRAKLATGWGSIMENVVLYPSACRRAARIALLAFTAFMSFAAGPSRALETRDLAGWWVAIDDTFPSLWKSGDIVIMEELLIVEPDGGAQNRMMGFWIPNASDCRQGYACSDAPVIATARLVLKGDVLSVTDRADTSQVIDSPKRDPLIRRRAVTASPAWTATHSNGLLILRAVTTNATRAFARIEPSRLRRLRAGMMIGSISASRHWRCFLANATAGEPAFAPLRTGRHAAPAFLDDHLRAASLRMTQSTADQRGIEHVMVEPSGNAKATEAEHAAYARVMAATKNPGETADAEVKTLFCLDGP
jgi:hypothetical protein